MISVVFGLKETQSGSVLALDQGQCEIFEVPTIAVVDDRVLDNNVRRAVNVPIHVNHHLRPTLALDLPSISVLSSNACVLAVA